MTTEQKNKSQHEDLEPVTRELVQAKNQVKELKKQADKIQSILVDAEIAREKLPEKEKKEVYIQIEEEQSSDNESIDKRLKKLEKKIEEIETTEKETSDTQKTGENQIKKDGKYICPICGEPYHKKAVVPHISRMHNVDVKALFKTREGVYKQNEVSEENWRTFKKKLCRDTEHNLTYYTVKKLGEIEGEPPEKQEKTVQSRKKSKEDLIPEIPEFDEDQQIDMDKYSIDRRKAEIVKLLDEKNKPMTVKEIARMIYKLSEDVEVSSENNGYYNRAYWPIRELDMAEVLEKDDRREVPEGSNAYILNEDRNTMLLEDDNGDNNEEDEVKTGVDDGGDRVDSYEQAKRKAKVGDRDMKIVEQALSKILDEDLDDNPAERGQFISYSGNSDFRGFETLYEGDLSPLNMWRKLFSNPELLSSVNKRVAPEYDFRWERKGSKGSPQNWVIKIEKDKGE